MNPVELYVAEAEVQQQPLEHSFLFLSVIIIFFFGCIGSSLLHADFPLAAVSAFLLVAVFRVLIAVASRCRAQALGSGV